MPPLPAALAVAVLTLSLPSPPLPCPLVSHSRIAQEKANEDINIRKMQVRAQLEAQKWQAVVTSVAAQIKRLSMAILSNPRQVAAVVSAILALMLLYYLSKEVIVVLREFLQSQLGKPALVRETSYHWSLANYLPHFMQRLLAWHETADQGVTAIQSFFQKVILGEVVQERVSQLALSTRNTRRSGAPYRHLLLHGPPGTGKTLIARTLAASSGMDYAVMSGGDVGPLGEDAVSQLHRLFRWASTSSKGLMLFIDEAEAFLNARASAGGDDSIHRRHALNALLYQTGTQSHNFMLVLATNRPEDLDSAVLDRMDAAVLVDIPEQAERKKLVKLYLDEHCVLPARMSQNRPWYASLTTMFSGSSSSGGGGASGKYSLEPECTSDSVIDDITSSIRGFSGREISKLFIAAQHAMLLATDKTLTVQALQDVTRTKVFEHMQKKGFDSQASVTGTEGKGSAMCSSPRTAVRRDKR